MAHAAACHCTLSPTLPLLHLFPPLPQLLFLLLLFVDCCLLFDRYSLICPRLLPPPPPPPPPLLPMFPPLTQPLFPLPLYFVVACCLNATFPSAPPTIAATVAISNSNAAATTIVSAAAFS
jgi:hypothetical protein